MSRVPKDLIEKWQFIANKRYADQAKWMLNGFWDTLQAEAESVWKWAGEFSRLDEKKADGHDLDEFWSHKFLETLGHTMTVIEMREKFRSIDADFNKRMSLIEFLIYRYSLKITDVIDAPQGENKEEVEQAKAMVEEAQAAVDDMNAKLEASRAAAEKAKQTLDESNRKAAESAASAKQAAKAAEDSANAAQQSTTAAAEARKTAEAAKKAAEAAWFAEQENKKALEELAAQEKAYNDKKADLERIKSDTTIGVVKRNKASNELDQLLAEDPLPLRKAKINQAATVKKSEKARAEAEASKAKAEQNATTASEAAEAATRASEVADQRSAQAAVAATAAAEAREIAEADASAAEEAKAAVELAVAEASRKLQEAQDFLEEVKKKGGVAHGDIWWMQREITEKKKYLPASKK